ncbi:Wzz/FepE/Etk N-terminal domain-containing protein, partial [Escherichia coli]
MNTKNNINTKESDDIDLSRFIGEIIDHWKIIFSVTCFFALVGIIYAFFASPVFQADALVQVEQKQGNAILNNLSQMLPDSQPQSAPEIALLRSRMILGKTVDDLNLQTIVSQNYFPVFGKGWARLMGEKPGNVSISRIYVDDSLNKEPSIKVHIFNNEKYELMVNG